MDYEKRRNRAPWLCPSEPSWMAGWLEFQIGMRSRGHVRAYRFCKHRMACGDTWKSCRNGGAVLLVQGDGNLPAICRDQALEPVCRKPTHQFHRSQRHLDCVRRDDHPGYVLRMVGLLVPFADPGPQRHRQSPEFARLREVGRQESN